MIWCQRWRSASADAYRASPWVVVGFGLKQVTGTEGRDLGQSAKPGAETNRRGAYPARTNSMPLVIRPALFAPANTTTASERAGALVAGLMNSTTEATATAMINTATPRAAACTRRGWRRGGNRVKVLCRSGVAMRAKTIATASLLAGGATGTDRIFEDAAFAGDNVKPRRPNDQQGFTFYG